MGSRSDLKCSTSQNILRFLELGQYLTCGIESSIQLTFATCWYIFCVYGSVTLFCCKYVTLKHIIFVWDVGSILQWLWRLLLSRIRQRIIWLSVTCVWISVLSPSSRLKTETVLYSKTLITLYRTVQRYIPDQGRRLRLASGATAPGPALEGALRFRPMGLSSYILR